MAQYKAKDAIPPKIKAQKAKSAGLSKLVAAKGLKSPKK